MKSFENIKKLKFTFSLSHPLKLKDEEVAYLKIHKDKIFDINFTCHISPFMSDAHGVQITEKENNENIENMLWLQEVTGITVSPVFNNIYVPNTREQLSIFINNFRPLYDKGIRSIACPHLLWLKFGEIQKEFPDLFIKDTVLRRVKSAQEFWNHADAGFDYVNLDRALKRDLYTLKEIKQAQLKFFKENNRYVKLSVLNNEDCIGSCSLWQEHYQHTLTVDNIDDEKFNEIKKYGCSVNQESNKHTISGVLKNSNFSPFKEDVEEIAQYFDIIKEAGRRMSGGDISHIQDTLQAYSYNLDDNSELFNYKKNMCFNFSNNYNNLEEWRKTIKTCRYQCCLCDVCDKTSLSIGKRIISKKDEKEVSNKKNLFSKIKNKYVYDLNIEEIEYSYKNLHMNSYVYVALMLLKSDCDIINKKLKLNYESIPDDLHKPIEKIVELSQHFSSSDTEIIRTNCTYYIWHLFKKLGNIKTSQLDNAISLFSALAYIPIISEKNDNVCIWLNPTVCRQKTKYVQDIFNAINEDMDLIHFILLPYTSEDKGQRDISTPLKLVFHLVPHAIKAIVTMAENNEDDYKIAKAFSTIEFLMCKYEYENDIGSNNCSKANVKNNGQIRYRNTLYLYGGNHFERMGNYEKAYEWYIKDIYFEELPDYLGYYLMIFKTIERLICAYRVAQLINKDTSFLISLIKKLFIKAFENVSNYSEEILAFICENPEIDLTALKLQNKQKGKTYIYGAEATRELFLISLFYNKVINKVDFSNIDYNKFFTFV